jgi:hypothetical protein
MPVTGSALIANKRKNQMPIANSKGEVPTCDYTIDIGFNAIPNNTIALAQAIEVLWKGEMNARFINVVWKILEPQEVAGRIVLHKLWVNDLDPNKPNMEKAIFKRDKSIATMYAIDANAERELIKLDGFPSDNDLLSLIGTVMFIKVMIFVTDDGSVVNWVDGIAPKDSPSFRPKLGENRPINYKRSKSDSLPF